MKCKPEFIAKAELSLNDKLCSFIGTDLSGPVPKAFVYWYSTDQTVRLMVRVGIVYLQEPGRFKSGSVDFLTVGTQCGSGTARTFVYCGPVRTKLKWSVPINEYTQRVRHVLRHCMCCGVKMSTLADVSVSGNR
jgi:hypothetical protein